MGKIAVNRTSRLGNKTLSLKQTKKAFGPLSRPQSMEIYLNFMHNPIGHCRDKSHNLKF